ncbi:hypothetical protein BSKO_02965 [Bryopsis sp. KO-2023]|nr:hypothetical protein BSKO_02965 [Bryopsis sp. KO-2023]
MRAFRCRPCRAVPVMAVQSVSRGTKPEVSGRMRELKEQNKVAFIPYLCGGDPNLEVTRKAIKILDDCQADIIELGVPYSDPLADGPVIQSAATRALSNGTTLDGVLNMVKSVTPEISAPLVLFTYYNPVMARGLDLFCEQIKEAGAAGLLVPDIPLEETGDVREACAKVGLELVLLVTPTTPAERMEKIAKATEGFVYLVSVTGVTGVRTGVSDRVEGLISDLQGLTDKPVSVGFGVSGPEQAKKLVSWGAEGVIVGSALVRALGDAPNPEEGLQQMKELAGSLREAIP